MQKQQVWNKIMFTIENAFVMCVLHYIISILDITFPHDNTYSGPLLPSKKFH